MPSVAGGAIPPNNLPQLQFLVEGEKASLHHISGRRNRLTPVCSPLPSLAPVQGRYPLELHPASTAVVSDTAFLKPVSRPLISTSVRSPSAPDDDAGLPVRPQELTEPISMDGNGSKF